MRRTALITAILFPGAAMTHAQQTLSSTSGDAAAAIRILNEQYIKAARTNDAEWFRVHMADDVLVIQGSGRRVNKAEFLRGMIETPKDFRSLTVQDVTVRVFGRTVQVDADAPWELTDGTKGVSRYIDTYIWLDGRWRVISAQITWLP